MLSTIPFSLCQGDIPYKVAELASLPDPSAGLIASKLHFCSRFFPEDTVSGLVLLREAPCSIGLVEKGHASGSFIRRSHTLIGPELLETRAFVCETKTLLRAGRSQQCEEALQAQFEQSLASSRKVRYTAMNAYCSHSIVKVTADSTMAPAHKKRLAENIVSSHAKRFATMSSDSQTAYTRLASQVRLSKAEEHLQDAKHHFAALALHRQRTRAVLAQSGSVSENITQKFEIMFNSKLNKLSKLCRLSKLSKLNKAS